MVIMNRVSLRDVTFCTTSLHVYWGQKVPAHSFRCYHLECASLKRYVKVMGWWMEAPQKPGFHVPVEADASVRELRHSFCLADPDFLFAFTGLPASSPSPSPIAEMFLAGNHMACWIICFLLLWRLSQTLCIFNQVLNPLQAWWTFFSHPLASTSEIAEAARDRLQSDQIARGWGVHPTQELSKEVCPTTGYFCLHGLGSKYKSICLSLQCFTWNGIEISKNITLTLHVEYFMRVLPCSVRPMLIKIT